MCNVDKPWRLIVDRMNNPVVRYALQGVGHLTINNHRVVLTKDSLIIIPARSAPSLDTKVLQRLAKLEKRGLWNCAAIGDGMVRMRADRAPELTTSR